VVDTISGNQATSNGMRVFRPSELQISFRVGGLVAWCIANRSQNEGFQVQTRISYEKKMPPN
jgi:hypothetical protein